MKVANFHMFPPALEFAVTIQSSMADILMLSLGYTLDEGEPLGLRYSLGIWIYFYPYPPVGNDLQPEVAVARLGSSPIEKGSG